MKNLFSIKNSKRKGDAGFTLVEMLVSVAIFSIFMLVAVSVVLSIIGGNRKAQSINSVVNNLNFAIESMVRDMKTGYFYKCLGEYGTLSDPSFYDFPDSDSCGDPNEAQQSVAFVSVLGDSPSAVEYRFMTDSSTGVGRIDKTFSNQLPDGTGSDPVTLSITPPDVNIKSVKFYISSPAPGGPVQPSIFMLISGTAKLGGKESDFTLQTFVSQRILNIGI